MKRGNFQGSITRLRNGRFWVRLTHPDGRREPLGTYPTLAEAESVLRGALDLLAEADATPAHQVSVLSFEPRYFQLRKIRARDKEAGREKNRYKVHLRAAPFAAKPMGLVKRVEVQWWIDGLAATPAADRRAKRNLGSTTIRKIVRLGRSVFKYAVKDGIIAENPFTADLELPAADECLDEPWDFLRPAEQTHLLTCSQIPELVRLWLAFAMGTGLRPSELHRLRLVDVELGAAPAVRVRKTKTNRPRTVPLFGLALAAWRRWLEVLPSYSPKNVQGLAWPRPRGGMRSGLGLPRPSVRGAQQHEHQVWRGYLRAAGLSRDLRWYDATRHTFATSLLCGFWGPRWQLIDVSKVLGHSNIETTERYAHVADEVLREASSATTAATLVASFGASNAVGYGVGYDASERLRATQDSNLRPSAPETSRPSHDFKGLDGRRNQRLSAAATAFLRAAASGSARAGELAGELAQLVIERASAERAAAEAVLDGRPTWAAAAIRLADLVLGEELEGKERAA